MCQVRIWIILQVATPSIHPGKQHMLVWTVSPITDAQESSTQLKSHASGNEWVNQDSELTLPVKATVQGNSCIPYALSVSLASA